MSTQQIGAAIGFAVGAYLGYPQLGLVAGSLVGGALTPKRRGEGPRLDDLKVTVSTYGAGLPTLYGTGRMGGNVIWSTPKIEVPTVTETGKGGGSENTSYQYFVHMAVALCYGPIVGIRKLWKDGKLIYDASSGVSVESAIASAESPYSRLTVYTGAESQMPDPVQEIYLGLGNAPPYRGMAYVQMTAVECPGGRVPQFTFEVVASGSKTVAKSRIVEFPDDRDDFQKVGGFMQRDGTVTHYKAGIYGHPDRQRITTFTGGATYLTASSSLSPDPGVGSPAEYIPIVGGTPALLQLIFEDSAASAANLITAHRVDLQTGTVATIGQFIPPLDTIHAYEWAAFDETTNIQYLIPGNFSPMPGFWQINSNIVTMLPEPSTGYGPTAAYDGKIHVMNIAGTFVTMLDSSGDEIDSLAIPGSVPGVNPTLLIRSDEAGTFVFQVADGGGVSGLWKRVGASYVLISNDVTIPDSTVGLLGDARHNRTFYTDGNIAIVGPNLLSNGNWSYDLIRFNVVESTPTGVADIISRQCLRAGLTAGQFDVSTITDTVHGYTIANPASSRANIEPLMTAYGIFATEEDGKIKFKKLAAVTSVVTISYAELASVEASAVPGDPMPLDHQQEAELPRSVTVKYIHPDFDYQTAAEPSQRQMTESSLDTVVDLPIATNANHAATVAQMLVYIAWNERNKRSFKVSRKYAFVSAGDGVTFTLSDGALQRWRITKVVDTGTLCEWEGVPADESIYTQTAVGGAGYVGQEVAALPPPTRMQLLDIPMLRDVDNDAGPYVALAGYASGWTGAELFIGDDATNLEPRGTVDTSASIGFAETVLGGWAYANVDETNLLTVNVGNAELSSATRAVLLAGTVNAFAIGAHGRWEICQFQRAESLGNGRYTLSGLRRGLRGTERNTGNHAVGDTFVLLVVAGLLKPSMDTGSIGQTKTYVAVSKGRLLSSGTSQRFAGTGEALMPYSPVSLRKTPSGADIVLTWDRRTRFSENVLAGIFPLGDAPEAYEVEIYSAGSFATVKRVITAASRTATYTSAQQIADFGATQTTLYVRVYQMAGRVGRGHALQATI